jgi:FKBP-type peptidyl-prolyl cis-trans isomerase
MITKRGAGTKLAAPEQVAKVKYRISLLDGTVCYTSDATGPKDIVIAKDNTESGLHEGLQYLHEGDEATYILPSHLAHGLMGDGDKIPPKASVVYEIKLISLK